MKNIFIRIFIFLILFVIRDNIRAMDVDDNQHRSDAWKEEKSLELIKCSSVYASIVFTPKFRPGLKYDVVMTIEKELAKKQQKTISNILSDLAEKYRKSAIVVNYEMDDYKRVNINGLKIAFQEHLKIMMDEIKTNGISDKFKKELSTCQNAQLIEFISKLNE